MFKNLIFIVLLVISFNGVAVEPWLRNFAHDVQKKAERKRVPGYTFAYIQRGKPASVVSYGKEHKGGADIDLDTVFRLASVSKTFTSMLMAKYVELKKLDWQTPVAGFAPQFELANKGKKTLVLQHIIGQSSGYTPNAYDNLIEANYPVKRVLNMLADLKPLCNPGDCYTYQNTIFAALEEYFAKTNSSYGEALNKAIIQPLNMPYASVGKAGLLASKNWARPHVAISNSSWRKTSVRDDYYRYSPAAGVNASIKDMIVWMRALLGESPNVISSKLVNQVTTPLTKSKKELYRRQWRKQLSDAHYGLGWRIYQFAGETLNYHGGWVKGYRADVAFAPDWGVAYVMLMNAESNLINEFTPDFWRRFFEQAKKS